MYNDVTQATHAGYAPAQTSTGRKGKDPNTGADHIVGIAKSGVNADGKECSPVDPETGGKIPMHGTVHCASTLNTKRTCRSQMLQVFWKDQIRDI